MLALVRILSHQALADSHVTVVETLEDGKVVLLDDDTDDVYMVTIEQVEREIISHGLVSDSVLRGESDDFIGLSVLGAGTTETDGTEDRCFGQMDDGTSVGFGIATYGKGSNRAHSLYFGGDTA
jgi:hypothetical protein